MANSIDLGQIYGLSDGCPPGGCGTTGVVNPNIPSLEQIASYNLASTVPTRGEFTNLPNIFRNGTSSGQAQMLQPPVMQPTQPITQTPQQSPQQMIAQTTSQTQPSTPAPGQNAQPAENGVSNAVLQPMTQTQIDAENPEMLEPIENFSQPFLVTADSIQYLNSFMRTQIGRRVTVQFLIGSGSLIEKSGYLLAVGANFILLNEAGTNDILSCDFYTIKFVTFYY